MIPTRDKIQEIVFSAIDEVNKELPPGTQVKKSADAILFGRDGALDSLQFVTLLVATEQRIEEEFHCSVTLANERALSQRQSPFRSVDTLTMYIEGLLSDPQP